MNPETAARAPSVAFASDLQNVAAAWGALAITATLAAVAGYLLGRR